MAYILYNSGYILIEELERRPINSDTSIKAWDTKSTDCVNDTHTADGLLNLPYFVCVGSASLTLFTLRSVDG
jgi:hypothetical protein